MPTNQVALLVVRVGVGAAGVITGWLAYPTGRIVPEDRAVPLALIIVGAIFAAQAGLDLAWAKVQGTDASKSAQNTAQDDAAGAQTAVGVFVAAITTVL